MGVDFGDVYNRISRKMTAVKWLQRNNIDKELMENYISSEYFISAMKSMVNEMDYSCSRAFDLLEKLMLKLTAGAYPENWLQYLYQYALNKSFEEAVTIELNERFDLACEVYLRFLKIVSDFEKTYDNGNWQSRYPLNFLTMEEQEELEHPEEYRKFLKAFGHTYAYEMMKLSQEVMGYNTLDHICGVHCLALTLGRQLKKLGLSVDLGRVSGAAGGHDIGKYGCKGQEVKRVPRLHYYYTDQWFKRYGINYIRNIAINHSTWDLELENLSVESLILIYCDFRIKNDATADKPVMKIYSLSESFYVILNKLENVDEAKTQRYRKVYAKLKDFEDYMLHLGVNLELYQDLVYKAAHKQHALLQGNEIIEHTKYSAINYNINVMYQLRDEYSLEKILEDARSEKDWRNLREYVRILEEYCTYLTQKQKLQTLSFLYDNLIHPEDDIRRQCAELMGTIIAIFDEEYRKEIPESGKPDIFSVTSKDLFRDYIEKLVMPGQKFIPSHKFYIRYSLSILVKSIFLQCSACNMAEYADILMEYYKDSGAKFADAQIYLLETSNFIPLDERTENLDTIFRYIAASMEKRNYYIKLQALEASLHIISNLKQNGISAEIFRSYFDELESNPKSAVERLLLYEIFNALGISEKAELYKNAGDLSKALSSEIFLSNMITETHWIIKRNQINLLLDYALRNPSRRGLHACIHFSNLLKVSEVESVRRRAGRSILALMPFMSMEERNEVAIELLRALEIEGNKYTEYIPYYAGQVILWLKPAGLEQCIEDAENKIKVANPNLKSLVLKTVGIAVSNYSIYSSRFEVAEEENNSRLIRMLGVLLNGLGNYDSKVKQAASNVIGKDIFGSTLLNFDDKLEIYKLIGKKILTLVSDDKNEELLFFAKAAGFNHVYRFISDYMLHRGEIEIRIPEKVAFFPGTFDPFSIGHKEIVLSIKNLGFEVYLSVDGFSWSKKTLPSLLRKYIINMSVSDELGVYIYPDIYPTNIANPENLKELRFNFPDSEVYMAVGSDVVENASSYKAAEMEGSIHHFSHIIFERGKSKNLKNLLNHILGEKIILSLSSQNQQVSSTQIRAHIDKNKDISSLVDPMAQQYIYENGFYQREEQDKAMVIPLHMETEVLDRDDEEKFLVYQKYLSKYPETLNMIKENFKRPFGRILIIKNTANGSIMAFSVFHRVQSANMYNEFNNTDVVSYIRQNRIGRILLVDGFRILNHDRNIDMDQLIINETFAYCVANDFEYAVCRDILSDCVTASSDEDFNDYLKLAGFQAIPDTAESICVTDMSHPCVLYLDIENIIKEPFRNNPEIKQTIHSARKRLQESIVKLYPGKLLISFDINYMNQAIIKKICRENNVNTEIAVPRKLGDLICVPYGDLLDRFVIPNTITKSLHTEKVFDPDMKNFTIKEFPHHLDLDIQVKTIKAFRKPVILVDNLLHKGYRIRALDPIFKSENVEVKKIMVGILTGRGKDIMDIQGREVDSAYFIPKLNLWFNETSLYPFIGGDAVWRGSYMERNLLPSINLVLPYTSPVFVRNTKREDIFNFSKVCIKNSMEILSVIEEEYHSVNEKNLNLSSLGQVFTIPRCPDHGADIKYDLNLNATHYLKNDLELLLKLETSLRGGY
ncbi:MAG: cytidyltransferase [Clostridiaceae bacterium]